MNLGQMIDPDWVCNRRPSRSGVPVRVMNLQELEAARRTVVQPEMAKRKPAPAAEVPKAATAPEKVATSRRRSETEGQRSRRLDYHRQYYANLTPQQLEKKRTYMREYQRRKAAAKRAANEAGPAA